MKVSFEGTASEVLQEMQDFLQVKAEPVEAMKETPKATKKKKKVEEPAKEEPVKQEEPVKEEPVKEEPVKEEPVKEEPVEEETPSKLSKEELAIVRQDVQKFVAKKGLQAKTDIENYLHRNFGENGKVSDLTIDKVDEFYDLLGIPKHE